VKHHEGKKWIGYARLLVEVSSKSYKVYKVPKIAGCLWVLGSPPWSPGPLFIPTLLSATTKFNDLVQKE